MNHEHPHHNLKGRWRDILIADAVQEHFLTGKQTACPVCGGKDRFRFDDKGEGRWYCNMCGSGDGYTLLCRLRGYSFPAALERVRTLAGTAAFTPRSPGELSDAQKYDRLRTVWFEHQHVGSPDCLAYLSTRGIYEDDLTDEDAYHLGWHHGLRCDDQTAPALLARYYHHRKGEGSLQCFQPVTIQRIWPSLRAKRVMPSPIKMDGMFCPLGGMPGESLGVAEGVITALSARKLQLGDQFPVWATYSAEQMTRFTPPPDVKMLRIYADSDTSFTGQLAAYTLARRLTMTHPNLYIEVVMPSTDTQRSFDFNDTLMGTLAENSCG